jgi:hypothetical protein
MMTFRCYDKKEKKYVEEYVDDYCLNHEGKLWFYDGMDMNLCDPDRYIVELGCKKIGTKIYYENDMFEIGGKFISKIKFNPENGSFELQFTNEWKEQDAYDLSIIGSKCVKYLGTAHKGGSNGKD